MAAPTAPRSGGDGLEPPIVSIFTRRELGWLVMLGYATLALNLIVPVVVVWKLGWGGIGFVPINLFAAGLMIVLYLPRMRRFRSE